MREEGERKFPSSVLDTVLRSLGDMHGQMLSELSDTRVLLNSLQSAVHPCATLSKFAKSKLYSQAFSY